MAKQYKKPQTIDELILDIVKETKPTSVEELVRLVQEKREIETETVIKHIERLREKGKIVLEEEVPKPNTLQEYLLSRRSLWFWGVVGVIAVTVFSVLTIPTENTPMAYIRWILGPIFILFLPGFCLVEVLFPSRKELDEIERFALSIGLSLAISPLTALVLNFTPWGIRQITVLVSLTGVTIVLATLAAFRRFRALRAEG